MEISPQELALGEAAGLEVDQDIVLIATFSRTSKFRTENLVEHQKVSNKMNRIMNGIVP